MHQRTSLTSEVDTIAAAPVCPQWCDVEHTAVDVEHETEQHVHETPRGDVAMTLLQQDGRPARLLLATLAHGTGQLGDAELTLADAEILAKTILARVRAAQSS